MISLFNHIVVLEDTQERAATYRPFRADESAATVIREVYTASLGSPL